MTLTADLSDGFFAKIPPLSEKLQVAQDDLLAVMNFESGVYASAQNASTKATGLIQFMPQTMRGMGWTRGPDEFRKLTAEEQLPYVERYLGPYAGRMTCLEAAYLAVFLPAYIPQAPNPDYVIAPAGSVIARVNPALRDADGAIRVSSTRRAVLAAQRSKRWGEIMYRAGLFTGPLP